MTDNSQWSAAQAKCWRHVESATAMTALLNKLSDLSVISVIPILSDTCPSLLITPDGADDITSIKALLRYIAAALNVPSDWKPLPINNEWVFRLQTGTNNMSIDVLTTLPTTVPNPVAL